MRDKKATYRLKLRLFNDLTPNLSSPVERGVNYPRLSYKCALGNVPARFVYNVWLITHPQQASKLMAEKSLYHDVFISYSRTDREFVRTLHQALSEQNQSIWVDWEDIPPTADWLNEIYSAIEGADAFLFVLSPDSVASEVCGKEVEHAVKHQKRLIPIVRREVDSRGVHPALASHNWLFMRETDDFASAFNMLVEAINTDLEYVRAHTRLLMRAREWESRGRNDSFVLRGDDLKDAEQWLAQGAATKPQPTTLHTEYILASRKAASARQRVLLGAVSAGLVVAIVLALIAFTQSQIAERNRQVARSSLAVALDLVNSVTEINEGRAAQAFTDLVEPVIDTRDAEFINAVCLVGTIKGFGRIVLPACERAVQLAPETIPYRSSRGIARAFAGDIEGAIQDFQAYVDWSRQNGLYDPFGSKRANWIEALRARQNPFTLEVLTNLYHEQPIIQQ